jgi:hypothetical protein
LNRSTHFDHEVSPVVIFHNEASLKRLKRDPCFLKGANITDNDTLSIIVSYTGGCKKHDFILATVRLFTATAENDQIDLVLSHENNADMCKKIVTEPLYFDLSPLKEKYQKACGIKTSSMLLHLMNRSIKYQFK